MSELKFACPVCGQHITCDSAKSGTTLGCPTCFQKIIVPAATGSGSLLLTAVQAQSRPTPQIPTLDEPAAPARPRASRILTFIVVAVVLVCFVIAAFALRDTVFKRPSRESAAGGGDASATTDAAWKSSLIGVTIPESFVSGRIAGRVFKPPYITLQGGRLTFREGHKGSQETEVTFSMSANSSAELAGRDIEVESNRDSAPNVSFRWKDRPRQPAQKSTPPSYVLRLQFGNVAGDRLPGKIYFCALDGAKSWLAGTFEAEIRTVTTSKSKR